MNPFKGRKPGLLRNLLVNRVDLVDKGGNQRADIRLMKREQPAAGPGARDPSTEGGEVTPDTQTQKSFLANAVAAVMKRLGLGADLISKGEEEAKTFAEMLDERKRERKLADVHEEVWDLCYTLQRAIHETLEDTGADRAALIRGSLDQFAATIEAAVPNWLDGRTAIAKAGRKIAQDRLNRLIAAQDALGSVIQEAQAAFAAQDGPDPNAADPNGGDPAAGGDPQEGQAQPFEEGGDPNQQQAPGQGNPGKPPAPGKPGPQQQAPGAGGPNPKAPANKQPQQAPAQGEPPQPPTEDPDPNKKPKAPPFGKGVDGMRPNLTGVPAEVVKYLEHLEANQKPAPTVQDEVAKALAELGADHPITKRLVALEAEAKASSEVAKRLEDAQQLAKYEGVAKSMDALVDGEKVGEVAGVLKAVAAAVPAETYGKLESLLKGADAQIRSGDLFVEKGRGGGQGAGSAEAKLNAAAQEIQKSEGGTFADAYTKALDRNPALYQQYLNENPKQGAR